MSDRSYNPTTTPGTTRTRCHVVLIRVPLDERTDTEKATSSVPPPCPLVEIHEQEVIRTADQREVNLVYPGSFHVLIADPAKMVPKRNPETDAILLDDQGQPVMVAVGSIQRDIYSFIRDAQEARDATEVVPE